MDPSEDKLKGLDRREDAATECAPATLTPKDGVMTREQFITNCKTHGMVLEVNAKYVRFVHGDYWQFSNPSYYAVTNDPNEVREWFWECEMQELGPRLTPCISCRVGYLDMGLPFNESRYFMYRNFS